MRASRFHISSTQDLLAAEQHEEPDQLGTSCRRLEGFRESLLAYICHDRCCASARRFCKPDVTSPHYSNTTSLVKPQ